MAAINIATRAGATYVGIESTFGTLPTVYRVFPVGTPTLTPGQVSLKHEGEREHLFKHLTPVLGLKSGSGSLGFYLRPDGTQLVTGSTPTVTPPDALALKAALGGESYAAGSTVLGSGASTTAVVVASGHGTRFKQGQWAAVEAVGVLYPFRVTTVATDTLTPWPSIPATPTATTGIVANSYTYFPTQANTSSVYVQHAKAQDATVHEWGFAGGLASVGFELKRGELLKYTASMKFVDWDWTVAATVSVAAASYTARPPVAMRGAVCLVAACGTLTTTHYPIRSIEITPPGDMGLHHVPELGGVEGNVGVFRVGERPFGSVKMRVTADNDFLTWYEAQTFFQVCVQVPIAGATAITKRWVIIDLPRCLQVAPPSPVDDGGQLCYDLTLELFQDEFTTSAGLTSTDYDEATAPLRIALL